MMERRGNDDAILRVFMMLWQFNRSNGDRSRYRYDLDVGAVFDFVKPLFEGHAQIDSLVANQPAHFETGYGRYRYFLRFFDQIDDVAR